MVETAARLFVNDGYAVATVEQVAREAGVAVQTVYYTFGTKGRLLCEAMEFTAAGRHDPSPVSERQWMIEALSAPSPHRSLALVVDHGVDIYRRAAPLWPAVNSAAVVDPDVADYWNGVAEARRAGMRRLVSHLDDLGGLRPGLDIDTATDVLVAVNGHPTFQTLVVDSGWSIPAFKGWLYSTLVWQLLPPTMTDPTATTGLDFSGWTDH